MRVRPAFVTRSVLSVWLFATFAGTDADCASAGRPAPSILLVTLDTTRADRIGAYGYGAAVTPTLDRLAREGILFEQAIAPAPVTLPSHASMLTGVYPTAHGVHNNGHFSLSPRGELVSEVLSRHGWRTAAFVGSFVLDARFGLDQGFEVYDGPSTPASMEPAVVGIYGALRSVRRPANQVVDAAISWLSNLSPGERFFAWVHFFDPHEPHRAPEPWRSRLESPYDAEVAFCDAQIERLLRFLEKRGLTENLLTVVAGDHGESLGEHGERAHGMLLYQSTTRVPLVISGGPVADSKGTRVAHPVSIVDLAPTFLALANLPREEMPRVQVPSLLSPSGAAAPAPEDRAIYGETRNPYYSFGWHSLRALVWRDHKLIEGKHTELYDLRRDSRESRNLADAKAELAGQMKERLRGLLEQHRPLNWAGGRALEEGERELLEALGYVVVGRPEGDPFDPSLQDPTERIGDVELAMRAGELRASSDRLMQKPRATAWERQQQLSERRRLLEEARRIVLKLREDNPQSKAVQIQLGLVEAGLGNHEVAIPLLEMAVQYQPEASFYRSELARAYQQVGRLDDAVREMQAAISIGRRPAYYSWFADHYIEAGEFGRASGWLAAMAGVVEKGSAQHSDVVRRLEEVNAEMRLRGQKPVAPELPPAR